MGLTAIQHRLEEHFAGLKAERSVAGYPLYAIEHGLDENERDLGRRLLNEGLAQSKGPDQSHWLVWLSAAAEVGYGYDGDEYWRTFERVFPLWRAYGTRDIIRDWFQRFVRDFGGVQPQGPWAQHFTIIAYPITHAIVPRYLQKLFLEHLNDLRFELAASATAEVDEIGTLIQRRYRGGFRRFTQFLEQVELTGRLVLALRDQGVQEAIPLLSQQTLARVARDISSLPQGDVMLRRVQRTLRDARIALAPGLRGRSDAAISRREEPNQRRPKLMARRGDDGVWTLCLSVPNFEQLLGQAGVRDRLGQARIRFVDTPGWMPGQALLTYAQGFERVLRAQPRATSLFGLQAPNTDLEQVLHAGTAFDGQLPWLLRCNEDIARQIEGLHVRAGQSYLFVSKGVSAANASALGLLPQPALFDDLIAYTFTLPAKLTAAHVAALRDLGLGHAVRANVDPVGIVPRWSLEEGAPTWLTTEEPIVRLSADFPVTAYSIALNGERQRVAASHGQIVISLGSVPIGRHELEVNAISAVPNLEVDPERFQFVIRPPEAWRAATPSRAGLRLLTAPLGASIDDVMDGEASIDIRGPGGRVVTLEAELFGNDGASIHKAKIHRAKLPMPDEQIRAAVKRLRTPQWTEAMEAAARVDISASVGELGRDVLSFAHDIEPIRWKLEQQTGAAWIARLVDESGAHADVRIAMYPMNTPASPVRPSLESALNGVEVRPPGALLVARADKGQYSALMSVVRPEGIGSFADILPTCVIPPDPAGFERLRSLVSQARLWSRAALRGHLASVRRQRIKEAFHREIAAVACGRDWSERWSKGMDGTANVFPELRKEVKASPGYGAAMQRGPWRWQDDKDAAITEFARVSAVYKVEFDRNISRDAFSLAFQPEGLRWKGDAGTARLKKLTANQPLLRGAFLAALNNRLGQKTGGTNGH